MGHIVKTPAGTFRANWRDPAGRQKAKTFPTRKEAAAYLAETETTIRHGNYVDPRAGRVRFDEHAARWLASRNVGARADERIITAMRTHVLPKWAGWPLSSIDHMAIQQWVSELSRQMSPASVAKCFGILRAVLRSAVRSRLIAFDPTEGVTLPSTSQRHTPLTIVPKEQFFGRLLPATPPEHQALVCVAATAGLRWGEAAGLPWSAVDLDRGALRVAQVAEETARIIRIRPYPKTRAGFRSVPLPPILHQMLRDRLDELRERPAPAALVFATRTGTPLRRSNFRRQVWRPTLVRAGMLGEIEQLDTQRWRAGWTDRDGTMHRVEVPTEREAIDHVAESPAAALRYHDLRHSYATWLISAGVPVNAVQRLLGHQQASTTLNFYVHPSDDHDDAVRSVFPAD